MPARKTTKAKSALTLNAAVSKAALTKISKKTSDQFVADLKEQGITSLEDLAQAVIVSARSGLRSGLAFDPEDFPICYKFTSYRPRFDQRVLREITELVQQELH